MIETERLIIRPWQESDRAPFAAMGQDEAVRRFLGPPQSREESDATVDRLIALQSAYGYCFWALQHRTDGAFLGFCGLKPGPAGTPIADAIEIGWRLAVPYWRQGYAREAAVASLDWAWQNLAANTVYAMTVPANIASWGLMERLGMQRLAQLDFDHPDVPDGDPLKPHIVYGINRPANRPFVNQIPR
ncbi:GNAT family N-acetyltransferase [Sphingomonas sp. 28-62-11]|uniref:GNAT family N-acetyltransferase n=1 Tax=Sphingomonas sp. 28-62-11 TaxID=1970432 RepID=UPI000BD5BC6D|nr:MAG: GNAT family N-acetyltransferase [Sphingomonas sp. 28-62-11]